MSWTAAAEIHLEASRMWRAAAALGMCVSLVLVAGTATARNNGIASDEMTLPGGISSCSGGGCHFSSVIAPPGGPTAAINVTISGPDTLTVGEAQTYTISADPNDFSGTTIGAGINVAAFLDDKLTNASVGILGVSSTKTKLIDGEVTHSNARANSLGVYSYDFTVTAPPDPGEVRLEGALNGFDGIAGQFGEEWNAATKTITVLPSGPPVPMGLVIDGVAKWKIKGKKLKLKVGNVFNDSAQATEAIRVSLWSAKKPYRGVKIVKGVRLASVDHAGLLPGESHTFKYRGKFKKPKVKKFRTFILVEELVGGSWVVRDSYNFPGKSTL
jgi:hypothetical protein